MYFENDCNDTSLLRHSPIRGECGFIEKWEDIYGEKASLKLRLCKETPLLFRHHSPSSHENTMKSLTRRDSRWDAEEERNEHERDEFQEMREQHIYIYETYKQKRKKKQGEKEGVVSSLNARDSRV